VRDILFRGGGGRIILLEGSQVLTARLYDRGKRWNVSNYWLEAGRLKSEIHLSNIYKFTSYNREE
jgi:hypothetical protein